MTEADAAAFGISEIDRRAYVRLDPAKVNIAPRAQSAQWFRLVGVTLDNGTDEYPNGDQVQTVEPWWPPNAWRDTSVPVLNAILSDIARGMENGQRYSNAPKADNRAAWLVVQKHYPDKPEGHCRTIIHAWLGTKLLYTKKYSDLPSACCPVRRLGAVHRKTIFDIYAAMPSSWNTPRMAVRSAS